MAKKSSRRTRDASTIAPSYEDHNWTIKRALVDNKNLNISPAFIQQWQSYYDRRLFKPDRTTRPPTTQQPLVARIVTKAIKVRQAKRQFHATLPWNKYNPAYQARSYLRQRLGFSIPRRMEVCIKRQVRKEVLHAKRKTGKSGQRKPRRNFWSAISCQRGR